MIIANAVVLSCFERLMGSSGGGVRLHQGTEGVHEAVVVSTLFASLGTPLSEISIWASHESSWSTGHESNRLSDAAPRDDLDAGRGPDQRRCAGLQPDASGYLPRAERSEDLRLSRLHRHEPRPDRGLHRQPARAVFPVRRRHPGYRYPKHPAGRLVPALVLPWDRHGPGDGPGRGDVRPGHVVDAQGDACRR